jgi:hypothetical protein
VNIAARHTFLVVTYLILGRTDVTLLGRRGPATSRSRSPRRA